MEKKEHFNKLSLIDKEAGNVKVLLNGQDITNGISSYTITRIADDLKYVKLSLEMKVIPENIEIKKEQKSSNTKLGF